MTRLSQSDRDPHWVEVRVDSDVWATEVERLRAGSPARLAAERERKSLEQNGVPRGELLACDATGADGTRLARELKVYVPVTAGPASQRPFGFVFSLAAEDGRPHLVLTAFGERHPARGTRSVYERAHKRLHGRFPDQERARPDRSGLSPRMQSPSHGLRPPRERGGLER